MPLHFQFFIINEFILMQSAQRQVQKPKQPKKRAIRPPEASFQVRFFREAIKDLKASKN